MKIATLTEHELQTLLEQASHAGAAQAFQSQPTIPDIMTPKQLRTYLAVKENKYYQLIEQGMPFHPLGHDKRFFKSEIDEWLKNNHGSFQTVQRQAA